VSLRKIIRKGLVHVEGELRKKYTSIIFLGNLSFVSRVFGGGRWARVIGNKIAEVTKRVM